MRTCARSTESSFLEVDRTLRDELPRAVSTISAETAARYAGSTTKAANYWAGGHCLPSLAHALALAQHEPHLRALILKILNVEEVIRDERSD